MITPERQTRFVYDLPYVSVQEAAWTGVRMGAQVGSIPAQSGGRRSYATEKVRYWPIPNCWTAQPLQEDLAQLQEFLGTPQLGDDFYLYPGNGLIGGMEGLTGQFLEQLTWWQLVGATGMVYNPSAAEARDRFFRRRVLSQDSWAFSVPNFSGVPQNGSCLPAPAVAMDTLFYNAAATADKGYNLRWIVPATPLRQPDYVLNFHFGQYCLAFGGDGIATLCEYCRATEDGALRWTLRKTFRYCPASRVAKVAHGITIFPLVGAGGRRFVLFSSASADVGGGYGAMLAGGSGRGASATGLEEAFIADGLSRSGDVDPWPDGIVAPGVRLDVRRDLRVAYSATRLRFLAGGFVFDSPWRLPPYSSTQPLGLRVFARVPSGVSGSSGAYRLTVGVENTRPPASSLLSSHLENGGDPRWTVPSVPSDAIITPRFGFTTAGGEPVMRDTPVLYGYELSREAITITSPATPGITPVVSVSLTASNPDPDQDVGTIIVNDPTDAHARLRKRGEFDCKVLLEAEVPLEGGGTETAKVCLFRGKAVRPRRKKTGYEDATVGGFGGGDAREYPAAEASLYQIPLGGMALQAKEYVASRVARETFGIDQDGPTDDKGNKPPWKVTDAVRYLLRRTGLPAGMVDIEDLNVRLYFGPESEDGDLLYEPYNSAFERAERLARAYLGGNIFFDPNSGDLVDDPARPDDGFPEGAFRLFRPIAEQSAPIAHFVTRPEPPEGGGNVIPTHPGAYPANTTWVEGPEESYVIPPDFNHLWVFVDQPMGDGAEFKFHAHRYNFKSYKVPGSTADPDPESPHYLGRERLLILPMPELMDPRSEERTQQAVSFVATVVFLYAGRARQVQPFRAPVLLYKDASLGNRYRTLRYGDPVTWKGQAGWFVRSVNPDYNQDVAQMADYEIERLVPLNE